MYRFSAAFNAPGVLPGASFFVFLDFSLDNYRYSCIIYKMSDKLLEFKTGLYGMRKAWLSMSPGETQDEAMVLEAIERNLNDIEYNYEQLKEIQNANIG